MWLVVSILDSFGTSGKEPACQFRRRETWVQFLGQEDSLEKEMATHSSILARKPHGQRILAGYSPQGCKVRHDWAHVRAHTQTHMLDITEHESWR